jgi:triosephosphate isomerase
MGKLIVGNWKMNRGDEVGLQLVQSLLILGRSAVICPPYTILREVAQLIQGSSLKLGAQDCSSHKDGSYTGEISASMIKRNGCAYVILGHSEARIHRQETDELVCQKVERALDVKLIPIVCIGESREAYEEGRTFEILKSQIEKSIPQIDQEIIIAYEPVWAIGTGLVPSLEYIQKTHQFIQQMTHDKYLILYGGSVNSKNAQDILALLEVAGVLVGGASLQAEEFSKLINIF